MGDANRRLLVAVLMALAVASHAGPAPQQSAGAPVAVLAYLDGHGDLATETRRRVDTLAELPCTLPVAVCATDDEQRNRWLVRPGLGRPVAVVAHAAEFASGRALLAGYLRAVSADCPPGPVCVWLRGHGLPPLAGAGERGSYRLLTGSDGGLSGSDLAGCLRSGLGDRPLGPLVLETCFGASLELCWELAPAASHLVALYGQAAQPGLEWDRLLPDVGHGVQNWQPAGACVYDLAQMGEVKRAFGQWCRAVLQARDAASFARAAQWARQQPSTVPLWQSCDLGRLVGSVAAGSSRAETKVACEQLLTALDQLVLWPRRETGSCEEAEPLGVTVFLPPLPAAQVGAYIRQSPLAADSGYAEVLRRYVEYGEGLLPVVGG